MTTTEPYQYQVVNRERATGKVWIRTGDHDGLRFTEESARAWVAYMQASRPDFCGPNGTNEYIIEAVPEQLAEAWIRHDDDQCLPLPAVPIALRRLADLWSSSADSQRAVRVGMRVELQVFPSWLDVPEDAVRLVDELAKQIGCSTSWTAVSGGHQYSSGHGGVRVVAHLADSRYAQLQEAEPEQTDAGADDVREAATPGDVDYLREDLETGEPLPDGVEGHQLGSRSACLVEGGE